MRGLLKFLISPAVMVLPVSVMAMALISGCEPSDASSEPYFHRVQAQLLSLEPSYTIDRYFVGQVESRQRAELGFELPGTLDEVLVDEGDSVVQGQLLATLDTRLLQAQIREIDAQGEDITAQLELARLKLKRQRELIGQGYTAEQRIDELTAEMSSLNAQLNRQRAQLESAQARLEKHSLRAPFEGEISRRYMELGAISEQGRAVFKLLENVAKEARVGVPSRLVSVLAVGSEVMVRVAGRDFSASVLAIAANVDAVTRTSALRLALPDNESVIDGEMLYVLIPEPIEQAGYWVPDTSLSSGVRGLWNLYVLVPVAPSSEQTSQPQALYKIEARSIELLHMVDGRAFIKGAVADDELIMSVGLHRVVPGLLVDLASVRGSSVAVELGSESTLNHESD